MLCVFSVCSRIFPGFPPNNIQLVYYCRIIRFVVGSLRSPSGRRRRGFYMRATRPCCRARKNARLSLRVITRLPLQMIARVRPSRGYRTRRRRSGGICSMSVRPAPPSPGTCPPAPPYGTHEIRLPPKDFSAPSVPLPHVRRGLPGGSAHSQNPAPAGAHYTAAPPTAVARRTKPGGPFNFTLPPDKGYRPHRRKPVRPRHPSRGYRTRRRRSGGICSMSVRPPPLPA